MHTSDDRGCCFMHGYVGAAGVVAIVCWELIPESVSEGRWYTRYGVRVNVYTDTDMIHTLVHACV